MTLTIAITLIGKILYNNIFFLDKINRIMIEKKKDYFIIFMRIKSVIEK